MVSDSDRTTSLQVMGLPVVLVTHAQLVDSQKFRHVIRLVAEYLVMDLKPKRRRNESGRKPLNVNLLSGFSAGRGEFGYLITRTRYMDSMRLSASMVPLSRCSSVSNMV